MFALLRVRLSADRRMPHARRIGEDRATDAAESRGRSERGRFGVTSDERDTWRSRWVSRQAGRLVVAALSRFALLRVRLSQRSGAAHRPRPRSGERPTGRFRQIGRGYLPTPKSRCVPVRTSKSTNSISLRL